MIDTRNFPKNGRLSLSGRLKVDFSLDVEGGETDVSYSGEIMREKDSYFLRADCGYEIKAPCSRCLRVTVVPVIFTAAENFTETPDPNKGDFELIAGKMIDTDEVIRDAAYANLPMKVLCKEDCKGLCPMCGKDLNKGGCGCQAPVDNAFSRIQSQLFDENN